VQNGCTEVASFTPLDYQATQVDCYPTSMLNALIWLFERNELPGTMLQRIYAYCLDGIEHRITGSYTSEHANSHGVAASRANCVSASRVGIFGPAAKQ